MESLKGVDDAFVAGARVSIVLNPERQIAMDEARADGWLQPLPLPDLLPPVPEFSPDLLPNALRPMVVDAGERMQVPLDFIAIPLVVAISSVIGRQCGIAPKQFDNWTVIPNLWGAVVAPPAAKKSPAIKAALAPLQKLASEAHEAYEDKRNRAAAGLEVIEAKIKAVRSAIKVAAKHGNDDEIKDLENSLTDLIQKSASATPCERRFKTNDFTIEKMADLLLKDSILAEADELTGLLKNLEKSGHETYRAFVLTAWNGDSGFTIDRIGRGTTHIPALCLSIIGGIQPDPLQEYFKGPLKDGSGNDGLLQRFQLTVYPDIPKRYEHIDRKPDKKAQDRVNFLFQQLKSISAGDFNIEPIEGSSDVPVFRFTSEAQTFFNNWVTTLERRILAGDFKSPMMASHVAKYRSLFPSLALNFEIVEMLDQRSLVGTVSIESAILAERWCKFLEAHANRIYSKIADAQIVSAHELAQKIRTGKVKDGNTIRSIYRPHWTNLDEKEKVEAALSVLQEAGWIRKCKVQSKSGDGAPSEVIRINPMLGYADFSGRSASLMQSNNERTEIHHPKKLKMKKGKKQPSELA